MSSKTPHGSLFVVSAPSGAGKTSLASRVLGEVEGLSFSISYTTRWPRPGERDGVDYHFVSQADFQRMIEQEAFLEYANVYGCNYYGTARDPVDRRLQGGEDVLLDIDVEGALKVMAARPDSVTVFVLPPSFSVLEERLRKRGLDGEEEIQRRLSAASREISAFHSYDYLIVNEDLEESVDALKSIIVAARCRKLRNSKRAQEITSTFPQGAR